MLGRRSILKHNQILDVQPAWGSEPIPNATAQWQWLHKTGWRDYDVHTNRRIEAAYTDGRAFVLVKSGKKGNSPMGIFFADMLQHDADTGNKRRVQRVGGESFGGKISRKLLGILRSFEKSNVIQRNFLEQEVQLDGLDNVDYVPAKGPDLLHEHGWAAWIARSPFFMPITAFIIFLNAIWLGIDAEYNTADTLYNAEWGFIFTENAFCAYFSFELLVRFLAYKSKRSCLGDGWFIFDSVLLVFMVGEIWLIPLYLKVFSKKNRTGGWAILRAARMLKLVRLGRLARVIQHWPELFSMCKAIIFAMRSTFVTVIMLCLMTYVFSIVFVTQLRDYPEVLTELEDFKTIHGTMWLLTIEGVLLDGPKDTLSVLVQYTYLMTGLFLFFIGISAFTLMNMLIGIICNVVDEVSADAKDEADVAYLKNTMLEFLECHDDDNNRAIKREEFRILLRNPVICLILTRFGVDVEDLRSMESNFFGDTEKAWQMDSADDGLTFNKEDPPQCTDVPFSEFLRVVLRLRQTNSVKVTDIVDLREFVKKGMEAHREHMNQRFISLERQIKENFFAITAPEKPPKEEKLSVLYPGTAAATEERKAPDLGQQIMNWRGATQSRRAEDVGSSVDLPQFSAPRSRRAEDVGSSVDLSQFSATRYSSMLWYKFENGHLPNTAVASEGAARAESSPLRQEAWRDIDQLLLRMVEQLLTMQAESSQKESALEAEVLHSRDQLSDIQRQVGQVYRLLGQGKFGGTDRGPGGNGFAMPQSTSHPWHASPMHHANQARSIMNASLRTRDLVQTGDSSPPNDVEV